MAIIDELEKALDKLEKQLRFHGHWQAPDVEIPKISISNAWRPEKVRQAKIISRIFYIRSIPALCRLYGPVEDSESDEFIDDASSSIERSEFVEHQFRILIENLSQLPEFDTSGFDLDGFGPLSEEG